MIFLPVLIQCSDNKKEEMMPVAPSIISPLVLPSQGAATLSAPAGVAPTSMPAVQTSDVGPTPHTVTHSPVDGSGPTQTTISPSKTLGTGIGAGTVLGTSDQVQ